MTKVFTLWALILICCSSAFADDGCTADTSEYTEKKLKTRKPIFVPSAKSVEKILPSKLNKYGFEDKMLLKDGTEVVFTVGGCAHYSYSYTFFGKAIKKIKDVEKLNRAKSIFSSLEVINKDEKDMLLEALDKALKEKSAKFKYGKLSLPCGDATCDLTDRGDGKLELSYDFAL